MENKTLLQKDDIDKMKPGITSIEKKDTEDILKRLQKKNKESE